MEHNAVLMTKKEFLRVLGQDIEKLTVRSKPGAKFNFEFEITRKYVEFKDLNQNPAKTILLDFVLGRIMENNIEKQLSFADVFLKQVDFIPEAILKNTVDVFEAPFNKRSGLR